MTESETAGPTVEGSCHAQRFLAFGGVYKVVDVKLAKVQHTSAASAEAKSVRALLAVVGLTLGWLALPPGGHGLTRLFYKPVE
jgi:hypothetical protein